MKVGIKETYQSRLNALVSSPSLSSIIINSGATSTTSPAIILTAIFTGVATSYMISENSDFSGASWNDYVVSIPFTLSNSSGIKTVYLKLKNSHGESVVLSDTIDLSMVAFALNSVSVNADAANTINKAVTVSLNLSGDVPTYYMISESSSFIGAVWAAFTSSSIPFTLSDVIGTKTVYVKVKTATQESAVKSDTINLIDGANLLSISINSGATETSNQSVSVAMVTVGTPTHYMISESSIFSGAAWIAFATPVSFVLSTGYATKTLYVKVKDANGESSVISGNIGYVAQSEIGRKAIISLQSSDAEVAIANSESINTVKAFGIGGVISIKDNTGNSWFNFSREGGDYNSVLSGYGITRRMPSVVYGPVLSGDTYKYPDAFLN